MNDPRQFRAELDTTVREALVHVVRQEPTAGELAAAVGRLKMQRPSESRVAARTTRRTPKTGRLELAVACGVAFLMCVVGSTDAWGQVTHDFSSPSSELLPMGTSADPAGGESVPPHPSFGMRILLLSHVFALLLGLLAMAVSWLVTNGKCLVSHRRHSRPVGGPLSPVGKPRSFERRSLKFGLLLYAAGVLLGCVWAQIAWGSPWRWDPREVFGLFSITVSMMWLGLLGGTVEPNRYDPFDSTKQASWATLAFGTIFLMVPIGSQFAAAQQPYSSGGPPATLPMILTACFLFFAVCLAAVWLSGWLAKGRAAEQVS